MLPSTTTIVANAYWIVLAPFLAGFLIIFMGLGHNWAQKPIGKTTKTLAMMLSIGTVLYGFIHSLGIFWAISNTPSLGHTLPLEVPFFDSGMIKLTVGCLVDNLATVMLIVVTFVSLLVQVYTHGYMREDPGYARFYAYLSLFTGSMLGLVVATNLFQMYMFWELVGACSYFLIGFWWYKESAARAALKAFIVNRIGDCLFLIGLLLLLAATKDMWAGHPILAFVGLPGCTLAEIIPKALSSHIMSYGGLTGLFTISVLIFFGPIAKSAQFPLHVWLPDAMEGPTPISALIHAATMVAAGVYLVARAYPIWSVVPADGTTGPFGLTGLAVVTIIGAFTAFMAATIGMSQFDIKRGLAWSTVSQLGYMFVGLGAGTFTGGMFHLFNHAFFKAMLFLCSGAVIHGLHGEQDMRQMGGLRKHMRGTAICFLIGCLSISGCPPLSGFFSKDDIIASSWHFNHIIGGVMIFTAFLTAFYMFRMYFMTFEGEYRGSVHPHNSPPVMVWPLIVLAVPSVLSGLLGFNPNIEGWLAGHVSNPFAAFVYFNAPQVEPVDLSIMTTSLVFALAGFALAYMIYGSKQVTINTAIANSQSELVQFLYNLSFNKWYFDEIYLGCVESIVGFFKALWQAVDVFIIDNAVNASAIVTYSLGQALKYSQNGRGQSYALVIFTWVALLTLATYFLRPEF